MLTALDALMALAIPWYAGMFVVARLFPDIPLLGRIGIGWGVGLGSVTWLMFGLSVLHIPFTGAVVGAALLLSVLAFAWFAPWPAHIAAVPVRPASRDDLPAFVRWPMIAIVILILALVTVRNILWPITDWDALAAYDLRARAFARYDSIVAAAHHGNLTYSFVQPPFTSLAHTWIYESAGMDAPAKLLYVTCFAALIAAFLCFVTCYRSRLLAYIALPGLLFSPLLDHAFIAYTNLPSAYGVFVASWATYATVRTGERRWCLMAGFLWGFAMITRQSLDPFVAAGCAALCVPWLRRLKIPWYPLVAAGIAIGLAYSWFLYALYIIYTTNRAANIVTMVRVCVTIVGPAIAISCLTFALSLAYRRRLHWYFLVALVVSGGPALLAASRLAHVTIDPALSVAILGYLHRYLWPFWGPLLFVFAICLLAGTGRIAENVGYAALFLAYCLLFVLSTYAFALVYPTLWEGIPGSALRHSYAIIPVFWAAIGTMPGTARIVEAFGALRPARSRLPAMQGD